MTQNPLVEQAKQGNVNAIASLMNRLLKSQAMLANVERDGDRLEILIESDLRSLDDEVRIPNRQVLVGMLKKWFITLEVKTVSRITVSWQQTGFDEPAWTEEIYLVEQENRNISENGGITETKQSPRIPPLPVFPPKSMPEQNDFSDRGNSEKNPVASSPDLDEMFGETSSPKSLPNINPTSYLNSDLDNTRSSAQDSELLFLSDIPVIPDPVEISDFHSDEQFSPNKVSWQALIRTPIFAMQLAQYVVVCVIIIVTLRGIHAVFGSSKAPKSASISPQLIIDK
ncbi:hypothetical protein B9G53_24005 [Pseudanabaena sp. SR411]|uniref:hypothetical protein n=1 Tax=Pseudanabaena sp. SR411 TaxID=1980935 RepID=UPI000B98E812|nr:hypothetical protein [Pseudanabaena sp. SR411]OYQ62110.1 hypothetical protein B9G53_24005 [Pseudanabaena sp. SR411]